MNRDDVIPAAGVLDAWIAHDWTDGVQLESVPVLTEIHVRTQNSLYEITVIDGFRREVLVRGGRFFPGLTAAHLSGSSMGGSFLRVGGVYVGFKMEIVSGARTILTSRVASIASSSVSP